MYTGMDMVSNSVCCGEGLMDRNEIESKNKTPSEQFQTPIVND